jgi:hypothetical protein
MYFVQMLQLLYFYLRTIIYKYDGHSVQSKSQIKPSICKAAKILKDKLYFCVINIWASLVVSILGQVSIYKEH